MLEAIAPEIAQARDVLDVGCGNGAYLVPFVGRAGNAHGHRSRPDVRHAASRRAVESARNAACCARTSAQLPFKPASFDFIFASHVLQFAADVEGVVAEFARCLQAGGVLIATGQRDDGVRQMLSAIVGPERWREYSEVIFRRAPRREADARPKDRYQQAFAKAGLRVEERAAPFTVTWADIDEWIRIRWMSLIPRSERERADAMLAELAKLGAPQSVTQHEPLILGRRATCPR